ncbi:MAG: peptidase S10 [Armatimonadetes bacterium]|nr:peptidase S10 [Armatimonadota bacterium]
MEEKAKAAEEAKKPVELTEEPVVVTHHQRPGLKYTVTTGRMPLKDEKGEIVAQVFFMAYTLDDAPAGRPLMFSFNGGPGSPSVWLHLGALGPKRVKMLDDGALPPPPYELVDNEANWLEFADLVFIDPIGTGFSRAKTPEDAEKYWGLKGDVESVADFIRLYLTRNGRWTSPLYMVGESYGTTRAAGLAGHLIDMGVAFNGIVLVSSILNFQTARFGRGNDLPYPLFLPTYTATAWFHNKLSGDLRHSLTATLRQVEAFANGQYAKALLAGDSLDREARSQTIDELVRFTGLSHGFVDQCDLRINIHAFCKELLRGERRTVGRLDSRMKGIDDWTKGHAEKPDHDPSMSMLMPPYTSTFNQYVRQELGYETDLPYEVFKGIKKPWDWGSAGEGHPDTSEALRSALAKNPHMQIFVASGYYDLATPYFATEYTLAHMGLDPEIRCNVSTKYYEAGHMMYINLPCLSQLRDDVRSFVND